MSNEVSILHNETGQVVTVNELLNKEFLASMPAKDLADLYESVKSLTNPFKKVEDEFKTRAKANLMAEHAEVKDVPRQSVSQDEDFKKELVWALGWDAVEVKSPKKLSERYRDNQEELARLLDGKVVTKFVQTVKYIG